MKIYKKRFRRIAIIMCFLILLVSLVSCKKEYKSENKQIYIGVACYDQKDTFIGELMDAFKVECSKLELKGYDISLTIMDAAGSQRTQDGQVQEMLSDGCDILCVNLADRTDPSEIIGDARDRNVPIIFFNREPVEEDLMQWDKLYYVGAKARQSGQMQGELAADIIKKNQNLDKNGDGKIQYVVLEGEMGHQDAIIRTECAAESIKENGVELEKLSYQIANWNRAQAQNRMTQLIGQFKTQIELVLANNDAMALGAIDAYEKLGYTEANLPLFVGIDGTDEGLEAIWQGKMAATVYNDKEGQAKAMAQLSYAVVTGHGLNNIKLENQRYIYLPYQKVTRDNVEQFMN